MLLRKKEAIEAWLNKYDIQNYELITNDEYGYTVNINGNLYLINRNIQKFEVKFNIINGNLSCHNSQLKTLEGFPEIVKGYVECDFNHLKSLKGLPKLIEDHLDCSSNKLESLEGCPDVIQNLYCNDNNLNIEGLIFLPKNLILNYIDISNNLKLKDLQNINNFRKLKEKLEILKIKKEKEILFNSINTEEIYKNKVVNKI